MCEKGTKESPQYLRISLAAAMTLGLKRGLFYRNAELFCINLLLTYEKGCIAGCAYCGLSGNRLGEFKEKSFIRVAWPTYSLKEIIKQISQRRNRIKRICVSMITRKRSVEDTIRICKQLRSSFDIPVSVLVSPTVMCRDDLSRLKHTGVDKIGVAIDFATQPLFNQFRGKGVSGPHKWGRYWQCLEDAVDIFGNGNAGPHFMVGMGETEKQMSDVIQRSKDKGAPTHLFSFFPEAGSAMKNNDPPPMDQYRRIQIARYLIDLKISHADAFTYGSMDQIMEFGISADTLDRIINSGEPFRTSGCSGYDGEVACNRPFANSRPGPDIRNYPFSPDREDIIRIRDQLKLAKDRIGIK